MRKHKKPHEWRELVLAQQQSELSVLAFCKQHQLSTSAFYKNRAELFLDETKPPAFVSAKVTHAMEVHTREPFVFKHSGFELSLPASTSPECIATLFGRLIHEVA